MGFDRNGWYPRLARVDGRLFCAYGNGQTRIAELQRQGGGFVVVRDELIPSPIAGTRVWGAGWAGDGQLRAFAELGDRPDRAALCGLNVRNATWAFEEIPQDHLLVAGNLHAVTPDLWASWLANGMRVAINGRPFPGGGALAAAGSWVTHSKDGEHSVVVRRHLDGRADEHVRQIPNYHQAAIAQNGATIYGGYGPTHGFRTPGVDEDLTVAPWGVEGIGLVWVGSDGLTWIATMGWNDDLPSVQIYLRPWGEKPCVIVNRDAVDISIIEDGEDWLIASCDATGNLNLDVVPRNSPRALVTMPERPTEPAIRVPDFGPVEHAMALSFADDPDEPDWFEFCTLGRDDLHAAVDRAKARHVPVVGYWDHHEFDVDTVATGAAIAKAEGVRFLPQAMCYPKPGETAEQFASRVGTVLKTLRETWPDDCSVYGAMYRQWNGTTYPLSEQQVLDCAVALWDLCRVHRIRTLKWFAWQRPATGTPVDGVLMFDSFREAARRMKAACPTRSQFPKQHAAPSVPQKPPAMPTHAALALPSYSQFLDESREIAQAFVDVHSVQPAVSDQFHFAWRRLVEGWTHEQILADLRGDPQRVTFAAKLPWQPEYLQFIGWAQAVQQAYLETNGVMPAPSDMAHNAWRLIVERYSFSKVIADITGTAPTEVHGTPATGPKPERVSGDALLDVLGNFCNLRDSRNRIVYTPALTGAPDEVFDEWMGIQRDAGSTHVFFGPPIGGAAYPGTHWENPDFWSDLPRFRAFIEKVLDTPSADGKGFRPVIFVGGDTFAESRFERWDELAAALGGLHEFLIVVPGWECIPQQGWTSNQYAKALRELNRLFPSSKLAAHMQPTRWAFSSNPVEADDPWQGGESECYKSHGGEFVDLVLYQTQHGRELYTPCTCPDSPKGQFTHRDECVWNRFEDGVARLGDGYHGWRKTAVCLYETVAYEAFRGQATSDQARDIATAGKKVADKWGVQIGYGNGLPW